MTYYEEVKKELKAKYGDEKITRRKVPLLEQAIFKDLMEKEGKCRKCGRTENLTLEHIVPKDCLRWFGVDPMYEVLQGNYAITCKLCNVFKGNRLDFSFPETKKILMSLLEKI